MKRLVFALVAVVLIAGCIELPDFLKGEVSGPTTTELGADIVTTQNVNVIPNPPVQAESEFTVSLEAKNQDDVNDVENVVLTLYDTGLCTMTDETNDLTGATLVPDQEEFVEWNLDAPTNAQIGGMQATCPIRYKITYDYSSKTQVDSRIISEEKLRQLQRAGETPEFTPNQIIGRGPIKISFSFGVNQPVKTDTTFPVYVKVEDKGSGLLDFTKGDIPVNTLVLQVHEDFTPKSCSKFEEVDPSTLTLRDFTAQSGYKYYWNNATIAMVKKKSTELRCSFTTPDEDTVSDERTYYFTAMMDYTYKMDFEEEVSIQPTLET